MYFFTELEKNVLYSFVFICMILKEKNHSHNPSETNTS